MPTSLRDDAAKLLRRHAVEVARRLQTAGYIAFWAGGCVRDILKRRRPKDYDIATNATPSQVAKVFPRSRAVGKAFAVMLVPFEDHFFEVATFRQDHGYRDGRHPECISFTDPASDAARRDFTVNAMFYDPVRRKLHDFAGGRQDLKNRIIRCVGEPRDRFTEDHLRMLRAVRFATTLGFSLHPPTADAIRQCAGLVSHISPERIRDELTRILTEARRPGEALRMMADLGLLNVILPEVSPMQGQAQPPEFHPEGDVFEHTVRMLNGMRKPTPRIAFAILFHDIGKPLTASQAPGDRIRFHHHASRGADVAEHAMRRLRFSNDDIAFIAHCVRHHMRFSDVCKMRRSTLRRMVAAPTFPTEIALHRLDCLASHGSLAHYRFLRSFARKMAGEPVLPRPWIDGHDILAQGIAEGPNIGFWRQQAYDAQLDGRFQDRERLLAWLIQQIRRSSSPDA